MAEPPALPMTSLFNSWNRAGEVTVHRGPEWRTCLPRFLVVGDNEAERREIADRVVLHGCSALHARGKDALHRLATGRVAVVVLSVDVPSPSSLALLDAIRMHSCVPVIVITAGGTGDDHVASLEAGADDVLRKPFELDELIARARAILRRQSLARMAEDQQHQRRFRFHGWELRPRTRTLLDPKGAPVDLTKTEFALLTAFLRTPRHPLSRLHLIRATRAHEDILDRSIDVQIMRLRRKLQRDRSGSSWIKTVRGFGYSFNANVEILD